MHTLAAEHAVQRLAGSTMGGRAAGPHRKRATYLKQVFNSREFITMPPKRRHLSDHVHLRVHTDRKNRHRTWTHSEVSRRRGRERNQRRAQARIGR